MWTNTSKLETLWNILQQSKFSKYEWYIQQLFVLRKQFYNITAFLLLFVAYTRFTKFRTCLHKKIAYLTYLVDEPLKKVLYRLLTNKLQTFLSKLSHCNHFTIHNHLEHK